MTELEVEPQQPTREERYVEALTGASDRLMRALAEEARSRVERDRANADVTSEDRVRFSLATAYRKAEAFSEECRVALLQVHEDYLRGL